MNAELEKWVTENAVRLFEGSQEKWVHDVVLRNLFAGNVLVDAGVLAQCAKLLEVAACPADCIGGAYHGPHGEPIQCQFCYERTHALAAMQEVQS